MNNYNSQRESYYNLFASNTVHYIVFLIMFFLIFSGTYYIVLPNIKTIIVEQYLNGNVILDGTLNTFKKSKEDRVLSKYISRDELIELEKVKEDFLRDYLTNWRILIYKNTEQESIYSLNPALSLFMPVLILAVFVSLLMSAILPINIGLMRHKIEREIYNTVDILIIKIQKKTSNIHNIEQQILESDTLNLLNLADEWGIAPEDLRYIKTALKWKNGNFLYRFLNTWSALKFYLRFYFTDKYSNVVLGLVYIGAAVLIIIIGMRGLKFIPSNQPSLIFFALGLEFSVLLTYAVTVIYSRSDIEMQNKNNSHNNDNIPLISNEFGNSKEVENLLRAFLREKKADIKN